MKFSYLLLFVLFSCSLFKKKPEEAPIPDSLEAAVKSDFRLEENTERDEYQHPQETLEFFGLKPQMTVIEVSPGSGYFTEILAPYLSKQGQLYLAIPRLSRNAPPTAVENERKLQDILIRNPAIKAKFIPFEPLDERNRIKRDFADMIIVVNSVHNWIARNETKEALKFCFDVLKPGAVLGIVQHRVREGKKRVPKSGYMYEKEVIKMVSAAGFKFAGRSDINANPKDTADYPEGVWTLPPTYRLGKKDHDKYEDIGESDRMTLRFVKLSPTK
jgi:predicted methyltransferase